MLCRKRISWIGHHVCVCVRERERGTCFLFIYQLSSPKCRGGLYMADKPSRALVLYGDGLASSITSTHTHLHYLASISSCGFLAVDNTSRSETVNERRLREFGQLLGAPDCCYAEKTEEEELESENGHHPSISEMFMGMRAAIVTRNDQFSRLGQKLGFCIIDMVLPPDSLVDELLRLLGFEGGKVSEICQFDLVILHVEGNGDYLNNLAWELCKVDKPGSEISSRLHLSVVASFGTEDVISQEKEREGNNSTSMFSQLIPLQSHMIRGGHLRMNVRHSSPMMFLQWQDAVTRLDTVTAFSFDQFMKKGCGLTIHADRFLHEVAFKLWKAPKYGA